MAMRASIHLPPQEESRYVRVELDGMTVGYLQPTFYDRVLGDRAEFEHAMRIPGAEEEAHSREGRWVVRLRGDAALRALHDDLSQRQ